MLITMVGCRPYDFTDEASGRNVKGLSVFYTSPNPQDTNLKGQNIGKLSLQATSPLYHELSNLDYSVPIDAEVLFDMNPSNGKAVLVDFSPVRAMA
jgi:hypothetical protein